MRMMTLDKAIIHAEEKAEEQANKAKSYPKPDKSVKGSGRKYNACIKCAKEHRQLAEWLRELKKWRALRDSINMLCDVDCEYPQYRESGIMCDACSVGTIKEYFEQIFGEEANTDAEIHS